MRKLIMSTNDKCQIQEIFLGKGKEIRVDASFANVLNLSKNFQKLIYYRGGGVFLFSNNLKSCTMSINYGDQ